MRPRKPPKTLDSTIKLVRGTNVTGATPKPPATSVSTPSSAIPTPSDRRGGRARA